MSIKECINSCCVCLANWVCCCVKSRSKKSAKSSPVIAPISSSKEPSPLQATRDPLPDQPVELQPIEARPIDLHPIDVQQLSVQAISPTPREIIDPSTYVYPEAEQLQPISIPLDEWHHEPSVHSHRDINDWNLPEKISTAPAIIYYSPRAQKVLQAQQSASITGTIPVVEQSSEQSQKAVYMIRFESSKKGQ